MLLSSRLLSTHRVMERIMLRSLLMVAAGIVLLALPGTVAAHGTTLNAWAVPAQASLPDDSELGGAVPLQSPADMHTGEAHCCGLTACVPAVAASAASAVPLSSSGEGRFALVLAPPADPVFAVFAPPG
jgi:hypothetical protein